MENKIQLFEKSNVRSVWDADLGKWWFSIVDIVAILTDSNFQNARKYWKVLKGRLKEEGSSLFSNQQNTEVVSSTNHLNIKNELVSNANQLKSENEVVTNCYQLKNELVTSCYQLKLLAANAKCKATWETEGTKNA